jgi:uncharacterized protein
MVHTYRLNGINIAVDGNSGSIHILDDIGYDILKETKKLPSLNDTVEKFKNKYSKKDIIETFNELTLLKDQGLLFTDFRNIEETFNIKPYMDRSKHIGLKALCLHVSHDCNLSCEYCFASKGDYKSGKSLMSKDVALKAIDYLVENSGSRHSIEIDFFGGEPLMNFNVIKEAVAYGKELEKKINKKFYFTITTNGILLDDEKIDFINTYMDNIVISIDGRKEVHDSIRYDRGGKGSYDRIIPLAQRLINKRKDKSYFIRGTFTSKNLDFLKDVVHLKNLGFKEISIEPVVGSGDKLFINEKDVPIVLNEYEMLAKEYLKWRQEGEDIRFYHFNINLYGGPCIYKRITACGAGFEYFAVSPEGFIYPCHQFVGETEFIVGDLNKGIYNKTLERHFKTNNILEKEECKACWAKLFCSGGCHANAWFSNKDISKPNEIACTLQKKRIECAIMIQAKL